MAASERKKTEKTTLTPSSTLAALNEALFAAFSEETSGEHNQNALMLWTAQVAETLQGKSSYDPACYQAIATEFQPPKGISNRKKEMLMLCNYLYRIAISVDFIEELEKENQEHILKSDAKNVAKQLEAHEQLYSERKLVDITQIQTKLAAYEQKSTIELKSILPVITTRYIANELKKHDKEIIGYQQELTVLEAKIDTTATEVLERLRENLSERVLFSKKQLNSKLVIAAEEKKSATPALHPQFSHEPELTEIEDLYHVLNQEIADLEHEYQKQAQKDEKKSVLPALTKEQLRDLEIILKISIVDSKKKDETAKLLQRVITYQYGTKSKLIGNTKQKWDDLCALALEINTKWCQPRSSGPLDIHTRKSIAERALAIREQREDLIEQAKAAEVKRIATAQVRLNQLASAKAKLQELRTAFCQRTNTQLQTALKASNKAAKTHIQKRDQDYTTLSSHLAALDFDFEKVKKERAKQELVKKQHPLMNTIREPLLAETRATEVAIEIKEPPRSAPVRSQSRAVPSKVITRQVPPPKPHPSKWYKALTAVGTVFAAGAAALFYFLSGPVGWAAGGVAGAIALSSWIGAGVNYKKCQKDARVSPEPVSPPSAHAPTNGRGTTQIELALQASPVVAEANARKIGLNPKRAERGPEDSLQYTLKSGVKLCFLASGGARLYNADQTKYSQLADVPLTGKLALDIPAKYRLSR